MTMTTGEGRKTLLIGDILEYGIYEEGDLLPLQEYELVKILGKLLKLKGIY